MCLQAGFRHFGALDVRATGFGSGHAFIGGLQAEGRHFGRLGARATKLGSGHALTEGLHPGVDILGV